MDKKTKSLIVYSSPAGSTRHVAEVIKGTIKDLGSDVRMYNLDVPAEREDIESKIISFSEGDCLWVGSPVYTYHALPPVMEFIAGLPRDRGVFAVPFVTWGAVSSGLALPEMGKQLVDKGYLLAGAAKIAALHSLLWQVENPLGHGRPDSIDDLLIRDLVKKVQAKINLGKFKACSVEDLNYQPGPAQKIMRETSLEKAKPMFPKIEADKDLCTQCGECEAVCPVQVINCSPYPQIGDGCISCFNCVRLCRENAFKIDFSPFGDRLRKMAAENNEQPLSKTFV